MKIKANREVKTSPKIIIKARRIARLKPRIKPRMKPRLKTKLKAR